MVDPAVKLPQVSRCRGGPVPRSGVAGAASLDRCDPKNIGDFNRDSNPDMVVANRDAGCVSILLGNGDGTFRARVDYPAPGGPASVVAKDLNSDGLPDLAVASQDASLVSILLNNGDGTFKPDMAYVVGKTPLGLAAADLNVQNALLG